MFTFGCIGFEARRCSFVHVVDLMVGNFARETVVCVMSRVMIGVRVRVRVIRDTVMVFLMVYLHFCHGRSG